MTKNDHDEDERDMRKIAVYDDEALKLMQGWTGGQTDPLYAISSSGGWNYAWVFTDAIANIDRDLSRVKKLGRNKFQLGKGTFSKAEIDELAYIRDALQQALDDPDSELVDEVRERGPHARAPRGAAADQTAADELVIYIQNTSELSPDGPRGQGRSVLLNALRKWRKGTYDPELAVKLFEHLTESGAKQYAKEHGSSEREWSTMFTPATRREAARQLEAYFRAEAKLGNYDHVDVRPGAREASRASFTPELSGSHVGRRVEIIRVEGAGPNSYFKPGQFGYVVGQNTTGGMHLMDGIGRVSKPGEIALLISKTREMRGGALWFSLDGVRFTGRGR